MKLLYHGDSPAVATGFGNVSRNLLNTMKAMKPDLDITVLGINERGAWKDPKRYPYKIYPAIYNDYKDMMGFKRLIAILSGKDPEIQETFDTLLCNFDSYLLASVTIGERTPIDMLSELPQWKKIRKILYTPIDNHQILAGWIETMKRFDVVVTTAKYGKNVITNYDKTLGDSVKAIYNGIDTETFFPMKALDRKINTGYSVIDLNKRFVVGYVGRNQWRKNFFHLIKIFSVFHKKHPDAFLYMHTNPVEEAHDGGDIYELAKQHGLYLLEDYYVPADLNPNVGLTRSGMNEVYNIMDVFFSCSVGEGFGLPVAEAMLSGIPVVAPDNTTMPELIGDGRGYLYKNKNTVCFGAYDLMRERPLPDPDDALKMLEHIYKFRSLAKSRILPSREYALTHFTQEQMAKDFLKLL